MKDWDSLRGLKANRGTKSAVVEEELEREKTLVCNLWWGDWRESKEEETDVSREEENLNELKDNRITSAIEEREREAVCIV